jgi:AcrR family transcriptional regulator
LFVSRPVNRERPEKLQNAILQYLLRHGIAGLSLRPLAKAVGSSPRGLLYYFGSKEKMIVKLLSEIRQRQRFAYSQMHAHTFQEGCWKVWKHMSAPSSEPLFRLFFEAYGLALRHPQRYKAFLRPTIQDWLNFICADLSSANLAAKESRLLATVVLSGFRGFMLDYCATHDRRRIDRAVHLWLRSLPLGRE